MTTTRQRYCKFCGAGSRELSECEDPRCDVVDVPEGGKAPTALDNLAALYGSIGEGDAVEIRLDVDTLREIMKAASSVSALSVDRVTGRQTILGLPYQLEVANLEMPSGPVSADTKITAQVRPRDPRQLSLMCRRRDNGRIYYVDDGANAPIWKRNGKPE